MKKRTECYFANILVEKNGEENKQTGSQVKKGGESLKR